MTMLQFPAAGARPVWIASYPRSGNTFLRIILENVFRLPSFSLYYVEGEEHRDPSAEALAEAPRLPRNWRDSLTNDESAPPALIKTHDLPGDSSAAIFIVRDGRAAINSYYHYHQKFAFEQPSLTEIIAGACQFGSWSDHYWGWRPKTRPKTLLLYYDELVERPEQSIARLAEFLRLAPGQNKLPPFEELQKRLPAFFRRGQNTDYVAEWSPVQLALFNQLHGRAMEDLGWRVEPSNASSEGAVEELAKSAAHLHRIYLEQLGSYAQTIAHHKQQMGLLSRQIEDLSRLVQGKLNPLLETRWVRLGQKLGAVPQSLTNPVKTASDPAPKSTANSEFRFSRENIQSSSPGLPKAALSAPNADTSAPE